MILLLVPIDMIILYFPIKSAGVAGVMRPSKSAVQVIVGTKVQFVADEMKKML